MIMARGGIHISLSTLDTHRSIYHVHPPPGMNDIDFEYSAREHILKLIAKVRKEKSVIEGMIRPVYHKTNLFGDSDIECIGEQSLQPIGEDVEEWYDKQLFSIMDGIDRFNEYTKFMESLGEFLYSELILSHVDFRQ